MIHTSHTRTSESTKMSTGLANIGLAFVRNEADGDPSTGRAPTLSGKESLLTALLSHGRLGVTRSSAGLHVATRDGAPGVAPPGAPTLLGSSHVLHLPSRYPVEAELRLSARQPLRMRSGYERFPARGRTTRPRTRQSGLSGMNACIWTPASLGVDA